MDLKSKTPSASFTSGNEDLLTERRRLLAILDGITDVIYVSDPDSYELLHVNKAFVENWGEDVLGKKCYEVLQERESPCPFCTNDIIFGEAQGETYTWQFQNEVNKRWYRCADKAIRWVNGKMVRFEIASDVTDIIETSNKLKLSEEKYRTLINTLPQKIFLYEDEKTFVSCNESFAADLNIEPEEIQGKTPYDFFSKDLAEKYIQDNIRVFKTGETESIEEKYDNDGKEAWVQTFKTPVKNENGVINGLLGIFWDITERKETEEKQKNLLEKLSISNKELEQFAYVASHDLQEPLRMVSSYTQLLEKRYADQLDQDARDFISYAVDGANRMQRLIQDLLSFSRITSRGRDFNKTDINSLLGEAISNLKVSIQETGAVVTNDEMPSITVDHVQFTQLLQNLISNAIKFRNEDVSPRIHISAKKNNAMWLFSVSDNGIGMDMKYHDRIYTIFQRLHGKLEYQGTGIGLSLCKRIVERHGGRIWHESTQGEGTTFFFTINSKPQRRLFNATDTD